MQQRFAKETADWSHIATGLISGFLKLAGFLELLLKGFVMNVLLYAHRWTTDMYAPLLEKFKDINFMIPKDENEFSRYLNDADVLFGSVDNDQYKTAENLKWIQYQGSGVNWIFSVKDLINDNVPVTNTRGAHASTIAEHSMGLLIALARGFYPLFLDQHNHIWRRPLQEPAVGLFGLSLGILGFGMIGQALGERASAFGMDVYTCDINTNESRQYIKEKFDISQLDQFLLKINILIITVPLTKDTEGMIGLKEAGLLKKPSYIIAVSRGGVVKEDELCEALRRNLLTGAALDVQVEKPVPPSSPLWDTPHLIITPHCSGESSQTNQMVLDIFSENLSRFLEGRPLINVVDKRKGF